MDKERCVAYGRPGESFTFPHDIPLSTDQVDSCASPFLTCPAWGSDTPFVWVDSSTAMLVREMKK